MPDKNGVPNLRILRAFKNAFVLHVNPVQCTKLAFKTIRCPTGKAETNNRGPTSDTHRPQGRALTAVLTVWAHAPLYLHPLQLISSSTHSADVTDRFVLIHITRFLVPPNSITRWAVLPT